MAFRTVALLSDLGHADETVGTLHAIVRDIAAEAAVIDLTHDISPFDVRAAALALARATGYLPGEVVVVAAVEADDHRPVAVEVAGGRGILIGPDNGLLASAVAIAGGADRALVLDRDEYHLASPGAPSAMRDLMTPAAAHLCAGVPFSALGTEIDPALLLPGTLALPREPEPGQLVCEVMWVDRYGACQLNAGPDDVDGWGAHLELRVGDDVRAVRRVERSSELASGAVGLIVDRFGMCALAMHRRSAADELGLASGAAVTLASGEPNNVTTPVTFRSR
jgi:S-adenosyl-L-methionine hydrolase (adenosine-forming)